MATHSSIHAWRITWTGESGAYGPQGHKELDMIEATEHARKHKADSNTQLTLCWQLLSPFGHSLISSAHSIVGSL